MKLPSFFTRFAVLALVGLGLFLHSTPAGAAVGLSPLPPIYAPVFTDPSQIRGPSCTGLPSGGCVGFCYAGDRFVGTVYNSGRCFLYQCDLKGGSLSLLPEPYDIPGGDVEHSIACSFGLGGFPARNLYVGYPGTWSGSPYKYNPGGIYRIDLTGINPSGPFVTFPKDHDYVRGIIFDPVGTFGYDMLVSTSSGDIYRVGPSGGTPVEISYPLPPPTPGTYGAEGMDVVPLDSGFDSFIGDLIVADESDGKLYAIPPVPPGWLPLPFPIPGIVIQSAEQVAFVPKDLNPNSPLQGLYTAEYYGSDPGTDVVKAAANQFTAYKGDLIVTSELTQPIDVTDLAYRVHWNGVAFEDCQIGSFGKGKYAEDGIFVSQAILTGVKGACCLPGGSCQSVSADSCSLAGGLYHGDGTGCDPNPCPNCPESAGFLPPSCLVSWYPFDERHAATAADVLAGRTLTWHEGGSLSPVHPPRPCGQDWSAAPGGSPPSYLEAAKSWPEHSFGVGSFSIFAWVYMNSSAPGVEHTLVDKRVWNSSPSSQTGYRLYVSGGTVHLQLGAIDNSTTYNGPALTAGAWHLVGASVCRSMGGAPPGLFDVSLYVDGLPVSSYSPAEYGNLDNSVALRVGEQSPGFSTGTPFDGLIAQLQFYQCCLSPDQVITLFQNCGFCQHRCYVPSVVSGNTSQPTVQTTLWICNDGTTAQNLTWYIAGLPAPGCGTRQPVVFSQYTGAVSVPAGMCVPITIDITYPPGFSTSDVGCYEATVQDESTGCCSRCTGTLHRFIRTIWPPDNPGSPHILPAASGRAVTASFQLKNGAGTLQTIGYQLLGHSSDGDPDNQVVSLNGLPPGTPVTGRLTLAPAASGVIQVQAALTAFQPLNMNEVVLSIDETGGANYSPAAVIGLQSVTAEQAPAEAATTVSPPMATVVIAPSLSATPNPFNSRTGIHFSLATAQSAVRVGVFDVRGRLVREVFSGSLAAGSHEYQWDGRDGHGVKSGAGIYFICVRAPGVQLTTRVVRVN